MARKVPNKPSKPEKVEDDDRLAQVGITRSKLQVLLVRCAKLKEDAHDVSTEISDLINAAVEKDHLDKKMFSWIRYLASLDASKRSERLFQFDLMRKHQNWDTSDLLEDRVSPFAHAARVEEVTPGAEASP